MATSGYLLDNNIISILAQPSNPRHAPVKQRFEALGDAPVFLPVIAIAEIEFGMVKTKTPDAVQQAAVRQFFVEYPLHLGIDDNTVEPYSLIRSQIWHDCLASTTFAGQRQLFLRLNDNYNLYKLPLPVYAGSDRSRG